MLANASRYLRFIIRRERVISSIWVAALVLSIIGLTAMYPSLFPTPQALLDMQSGLNTPAMIAMMGPVYGLDALTPAIAMAQECLIWVAITIIVMNIFLVNRHTRIDEELGRHEMLISLPVGRLTGSFVTLFWALLMNLAVALLGGLGILALNIEGTTAAGAFAYTGSIAAQGFLFAAITLLAAQLFSTAHGASGFSFLLLGLCYILRASGDMSGNALSVISPLGLGLKVEAFYTDAYWPIYVLLGEAVVFAVAAFAVNAIRDIGAGVIPARKGRAHASRFLCSPFGFAWRMTSRTFLIWAIAVFALGASYGTVVGELDKFVESNETIKQMLQAIGGGSSSLVDAYVPMLSGIMGMLISIPAINAINRLRAEERRGRLEQLYSKRVSRATLYLCFAAIAVIEAVVLTALSALGLYATSASTGLLPLDTLLAASYVQLPAILVVAGLTALLLGCLPRFTALVWAVFGYSFLMLYFGRLFDVPEAARRISPFGNVPLIPVEQFALTPEAILVAIALVLFAAGFISYRRRDMVWKA
jgi:ABC-2 type transport system permease protein